MSIEFFAPQVRAESPARVDMAGAWTDTPPICSDYGGNVVGAAVKVDRKVRRKADTVNTG